MSDTSQGPGWWLASDGRWYPPEAQPGPTPLPDAPPPAGGPGGSPPQRAVGSGGRWYHSGWFIALSCLFCFPIGLVLLWTHPTWSRRTKGIVSAVVLVVVVASVATSPKKPQTKAIGSTSATTTSTTVATTTTTEDPAVVAVRSGDVALCKDGTYSDNTDFAKTCSSHKGVKHWLAKYVACKDGTVFGLRTSADCGDHDGFGRLMPASYVPTATATDLALCSDGTYSDNTDLNRTCSSHAGLKRWLAPYGRCKDGTVVHMSHDASCGDHGGFGALMPADYVPPTTTTAATTTTATSPPTTQYVPPPTQYVPPPTQYIPPPTEYVPPATDPPGACHPLSNAGHCYEPGQYCRNSDHGVIGVAGDGRSIQCVDNNGWRWEPI